MGTKSNNKCTKNLSIFTDDFFHYIKIRSNN